MKNEVKSAILASPTFLKLAIEDFLKYPTGRNAAYLCGMITGLLSANVITVGENSLWMALVGQMEDSTCFREDVLELLNDEKSTSEGSINHIWVKFSSVELPEDDLGVAPLFKKEDGTWEFSDAAYSVGEILINDSMAAKAAMEEESIPGLEEFNQQVQSLCPVLAVGIPMEITVRSAIRSYPLKLERVECDRFGNPL